MNAKTAKNAPAPKIKRPKINKHPQNTGKQPEHPEIYTQQLNPISKKVGQPEYKDEPMHGSQLKAIIARLRNS